MTAGSGSRTRLIVTAAVVGLWFAALTTLALRTANPVTVNREQLLAAEAVVVGTLEAPPTAAGAASFRMRATLAGTGFDDKLDVAGVAGNRLAAGTDYVLPVRRSGTGYRLVPTPAGAPLVYPATPETLKVVTDILRTDDPRPYP